MNGEGQPFPPRASREDDGWNFALYFRPATGVTLLIHGEKDFAMPLTALTRDPLRQSDIPTATPARNLRVLL
jgi:hypothetical protein